MNTIWYRLILCKLASETEEKNPEIHADAFRNVLTMNTGKMNYS